MLEASSTTTITKPVSRVSALWTLLCVCVVIMCCGTLLISVGGTKWADYYDVGVFARGHSFYAVEGSGDSNNLPHASEPRHQGVHAAKRRGRRVVPHAMHVGER
jgi:hypothetical protein